jgi:hypothetical protein
VRLIRAVSGLDGWVGFGGAVAGPDDQGEDGPGERDRGAHEEGGVHPGGEGGVAEVSDHAGGLRRRAAQMSPTEVR